MFFVAVGTQTDTIGTQTDTIGTQTDTIGLNPVMSPEAEGVQIHLNVVTVLLSPWHSTDTERGLVGSKMFYMLLLILNHSFRTCCGPKP